jgi:glyoxylase-like metal-dependent hydrolase (beta-lactamase superfamily II)
MDSRKITDSIYQVAGPDITGPYDCSAYLLDVGGLLLIDAGSGLGFRKTIANISSLGYNPRSISHLLLTHCHYDHMGAAPLFREYSGAELIMHTLDARIIEAGDSRLTAAICFNVQLKPFPIDVRLSGEESLLSFPNQTIHWIHTPGHTPGSISPYLDTHGRRILFGQDISAPLLEAYDCDPAAWQGSIRKLMDLEADVFCDGHAGPITGKREIRRYLQYVYSARTSGKE